MTDAQGAILTEVMAATETGDVRNSISALRFDDRGRLWVRVVDTSRLRSIRTCWTGSPSSGPGAISGTYSTPLGSWSGPSCCPAGSIRRPSAKTRSMVSTRWRPGSRRLADASFNERAGTSSSSWVVSSGGGTVKLGTQIKDDDQRTILTSLLDGGANWWRSKDCLETCPFFTECDGNGPAGLVCASDWKRATVSPDTLDVVEHVLDNFDHYNCDDLKDLTLGSGKVAALQRSVRTIRDAPALEGTAGTEGSTAMSSPRPAWWPIASLKTGLAGRRQILYEGCGLDYLKKMGDLSRAILEVHHKIRLGGRVGVRKTRFTDLALLCANCHRIVHSTNAEPLTIEQLRARL